MSRGPSGRKRKRFKALWIEEELYRKIEKLRASLERERGGRWTYSHLVAELLKAFEKSNEKSNEEV